jgi:hypothetical protein
MSSFAIVPAFEMISILSKLKPVPKFNMEHHELHPNYIFISYFDTVTHLWIFFARRLHAFVLRIQIFYTIFNG